LQSVSQALRILRLLQSHTELGVSEIARALDVGSSTAHRLLATLVDARFVSQEHSGGKYELGPAMRSGVSRLDELRDVAAPHMAGLRDRSSETVHLAVLRSTETHFVSAFESPRIMRVTSRVGQSLPAHVTAAGKLLLAQLSDEAVRELYGHRQPTGGTAAAPQSLDDVVGELDGLRAAGYGRNLAESEAGVAALAIALRDPDGETYAALTVTGPDSLFNPAHTAELSARESELLDMLRQTADLIHSDLAATAPPSLHRKS
jgi:DNA-binding IclR family transcriptional regulator